MLALLNLLVVILFVVGGVVLFFQWLQDEDERGRTMEELIEEFSEEEKANILSKEIDGEVFFVKDPDHWDEPTHSLVNAFEEMGIGRDFFTRGFTPLCASRESHTTKPPKGTVGVGRP